MEERERYLAHGHSREWTDWWLGFCAAWNGKPLTKARERELFLVGRA